MKRAMPNITWVRILGTAAGIFLGGVLLFAVATKALDPLAFQEQIGAEGLDLLLSAPAVSWIALALEAALGFALLAGLRRLWILFPAVCLVLFFLFLTGRAYWLEAHGLLGEEASSCGCFGHLVDRSPAEAFWQDLLLLVPPLALAFLGRGGRRPLPVKRLAAIGVATAAVMGFAWSAPALPLDDWATRLRPGVEVGELCVGSGASRLCLADAAPELLAGDQWIVLEDLERPGVEAAVEALNSFIWSEEAPLLTVLSAATSEQVHAFVWQTGPAFEVREVPEALLRPLYRALPRSFRVVDGSVLETHSGLPPGARETPGSAR
jgi:hypothetical protein